VPIPLSIVPVSPAILGAVQSPGTLVLYLTGLGATVPAVAEGVVAPIAPLSQNVAHVSVLVNGQATSVFFSGMAPGLVGVYQLNVFLPGDAPSKFEVVVQAGDRTSVPFVVQP